MDTSLVISKPVTQPMVISAPQGDDYRLELNNSIRTTFFVKDFLHIFDQVWDEGVEEIDFEENWHHNPYRLAEDEMVLSRDESCMMRIYYGTDKGIVVFRELHDGVEIDYPSALQFVISEVFSAFMN